MNRILLLIAFSSITFMAVAQTKKPATPVKSSVSSASMSRGKQVYTKYCLTCHQLNGEGVPNLNPPLTKTSWVLGNKATLIGIVLNGMTGDIEIDDNVYTNNMPAMPMLTDQEVADVLTYVRNSFGNKASAVTPAEVKAVRAKKK